MFQSPDFVIMNGLQFLDFVLLRPFEAFNLFLNQLVKFLFLSIPSREVILGLVPQLLFGILEIGDLLIIELDLLLKQLNVFSKF